MIVRNTLVWKEMCKTVLLLLQTNNRNHIAFQKKEDKVHKVMHSLNKVTCEYNVLTDWII